MLERVINTFSPFLSLSFTQVTLSNSLKTDFLFYNKMKAEKEIWKDVPEHEGKYQASNLGRVKSLKRKVRHPLGGLKTVNERILKVLNSGGFGYKRVFLGNKNPLLLHRIVAKTFIPNPENKPCVNHIDGDKSNNDVANLGWVTYSENELHSYRVLGKVPTGLGKPSKLKGRLNQTPNCKRVAQYNSDGKLIKIYPSGAEAARQLNFCPSGITSVCRGKYKQNNGWVFKYV